MRLLTCSLLILCLAATPAPLAHLDAGTVDTISIDITVGVLGPGARYHLIAHRRNASQFVSDDGKTVISQASLDNVLQALAAPATQHFDFSRTWITPAVLQSSLDSAEAHFLGPNRANAAAEKAYRAAFLDWNDLRARCERAMQRPFSVTDYYPHVAITMKAGTTQVRVSSESQREFLVPMSVLASGAEQETWDPALPVAIYGLLPQKTPLRDVFAGGDVLPTWASLAAGSHDVLVAIKGRDDTPKALRSDFFQSPCGMVGHPYAPY